MSNNIFFSKDNKLIEQLKNLKENYSRTLSERVHGLYKISKSDSNSNLLQDPFDENGLLDFDKCKIQHLLFGEAIDEKLLIKPHVDDEEKLKRSEIYNNALEKIWKSSNLVRNLALKAKEKLSIGMDEIKEKYFGINEEKLKIFSQSKVLYNSMHLFKSDKKEDIHLFCMILTSFLGW